MFISYRFVFLAVAGFIPMVLWPGWGTVFALLGVLTIVVVIELGLTPSPRAVTITRSENRQIRNGTARGMGRADQSCPTTNAGPRAGRVAAVCP